MPAPYNLSVFINCPFDAAYQPLFDALDRKPHRYQQFISDIAGQDIESHENDASLAIRRVRDWLQTHRPKVAIPGGEAMAQRFAVFQSDLPAICAQRHVKPHELTFVDLGIAIHEWLAANPV